jgi:FixJ family two-component response regulator
MLSSQKYASDLALIVTTRSCDVPAAAVRAMKAAAADVLVLTTPFAADALVRAVRQAIEGGDAAPVRDAEMRAIRRSYASLTRREQQVMALVVSGRLNKQAARDLGIKEGTVKAHRGKVMRKMNAGSLAHLVNMAAGLRVEVAAHHRCVAGATVPTAFAYPSAWGAPTRKT